MASVNLNDRVRIRLNKQGKEILIAAYPNMLAGNTWDAQLWEVMQVFGPNIHLGFRVPIETEIKFLE